MTTANHINRDQVSDSRVVKVAEFTGSLPTRALYIYLPPGYDTDTQRYYPVLYMHDGQNCFEAYREDSYAGMTWAADRTADELIRSKKIRPCIIVGVSNGQEARMVEYLPPYASWQPPPARKGRKKLTVQPDPIKGKADQTVKYYQEEIAPFIQANYRVLAGRNQTATCGSSMGGLFTTYIAWDHPAFARHHAALSASYWITKKRDGRLEIADRIRQSPRRNIRLYLDSGTADSPGKGDDNAQVVKTVRDSLYETGYQRNEEIVYHIAEGAVHNEAAWAARFPAVLQFLFPPIQRPATPHKNETPAISHSKQP